MEFTPIYKSEEYLEHEQQLRMVDHIFNGIDSATDYLRRFPKEEDIVFEERKEDASIDNFINRTIHTTKNIIFRKNIDTAGILNAEVEKWSKSIDFTNTINEFGKMTLVNRIKDGVSYVLVDSVNYNAKEVTSKLVQESLNIRPYFVNIKRSDVINYSLDAQGQYQIFTILETYEDDSNPYRKEIKEQVRVFLAGGIIEIWRENELFDRIETSLSVIPIVKIGNDLIPPLYDQSKINIQHLNRHSECNNYVRVGASPFLAVFGSLEGEAPKTLGINSGLKFNDTESDVKWIEMTGANFAIIKDWMIILESQMEKISIEFVTELRNATATEVEKSSTSNESKLSNYSSELQDGLNLALEYLGLYKENLGENTISVNSDFASNILTAEQFNAIMSLRTNGDVSYERLMKLLERGELLPMLDEKEIETEKALLINEGNF